MTNSISIAAVPPSSDPIDMDISVIIVTSAFCRTYPNSIFRFFSPLETAPSTYLFPSCSRTAARTCRIYFPVIGIASASVGSTKLMGDPEDKIGNQPSFNAKKYKSKSDTTKLGRLFPIKLRKRITASVTFPFFTAAKIPSGTDSKTVTITDNTVSFNVFGSAVSNFPDTAAPSI